MRTLLLAAALLLAAPVAATADEHAAAPTCFASTQWHGWSAPGGRDFLYLRVGLHDVYRVQLTPGTRVQRWGDRFLINENRGSGWICSPLDLDLTLSDHHGFREGLIAREIRKLTPEEVSAIPPRDMPS